MRPSYDPVLLAHLKQTAHAAADVARVETLRHFRAPALEAENKQLTGFDPVTVADRASEAAMRVVIAEARPEDGILGEEDVAKTGTSGLTWVLDPIDGTRGYISGTPTWGVLIAVQDAQGPLYGLIDQPYISERFEGGLGMARYAGPLGERPLQTSRVGALRDATILTTFPEVGTEAEARAFHAVASACKLTRYGMDCYGYALLAAGHVDLVIEAGLAAYDIAAPIAVVQAAGGIATNWEGGPAHGGGRVIAAATPELHAAALHVVQNAL